MISLSSYFEARRSWSATEYVFWSSLVVLPFVPGVNVPLMMEILIWGLFALSLDLLLGFRGLPTLGHAAFFGIGAYTAGLLAKHGWSEPLSGLLGAAAVAGVIGWLTGRLVAQIHGVALLMITLGLNLMLADAALHASTITGGDDGLQGMLVDPILGLFKFDFAGQTGYYYTLSIVLLVFAMVRALVNSPFGLALIGARENPRRMMMLGASVNSDVSKVFLISAAIAGVAGGLMAQTTQFVSLESLAFTRSVDVLVVLVIGGSGYLYGAFLGALVFVGMRDWLAAINPAYWYFWMGLLLVLIVSFFRKGLFPSLQGMFKRLIVASSKEAS